MDDLNFCPFCSAAQHKILICKEDLFFCKDCNKFFNLAELKLKCPKCNGEKFTKGDFPSPSGEVVFQCKDCKKMFSATEFFTFNKLK
jgi:Zn finger protein HypA/HybF involved in hydrogenase expression